MIKKNIKHIHPMTPMQEGMLFHALYDQTSNPYFEQCQFRLRGHLDIPLFEAAWNEVMRRHDVLRTRFVFKNVPHPKQVVLKEQTIEFVFHDLLAQSQEQQEQIIHTYKQQDWARGFNLAQDVLMRMALFQVNHHIFEVVHSFHHILLDGWSIGIIHEESFQIHAALTCNQPHNLPQPIQFGTYLQWLAQQDQSAAQRYWRRHLSGYHHTARLPGQLTPNPAANNTPFQAEERDYIFTKSVTDGLRQLAARHRVTQNTVMQTIWGLLLSRYNHVNDVVFISTVSGRPPEIPDVERMVGLFINAIPIRIRAEPRIPFHRLLRQVQNDATDAKDYHHHSLAEIQANSDLRHALLDHILVFENYLSAEMDRFSFADAQGNRLHVEHYKQVDHSNYPLTVQVVPGERLGFNMILNRAAIDPVLVDELVANLQAILEQVIANDGITLETITLPKLTQTHPIPLHSHPVRVEHQATPADFKKDPKKVSLVVAATFTADPIAPHIRWWGSAFGLNIDVRFAGYNQVFQELLDPNGLLSTHTGPAVLLIRFEDWIRDLSATSLEAHQTHLELYFQQLTHALGTRHNTTPWLIGLLPPAQHLPEPAGILEWIQALYQRFRVFLLDHPTVRPLDLTQLAEQYAIDEIFDQHQDQTGHIPFSDAFYAAMALHITRRIHASLAAPFKVIALDCDNTLWQGICGEAGSSGVTITPDHQMLQQFMLDRHHEGFLLVLLSKNNAQDVWDVFEQHQDMILQRNQIIAHRINWHAKSRNIRELANELDLGLESFLFLDDSGVECTEMMTNRPEVLTLRLPEDPADFLPFLRHVWAFDRFTVTLEDRNRSSMYQVEQQRRQHQEQALCLDDFLQTLDIQVFMEPIRLEQLPRVAQLTQRTNQFNLSTIRRTVPEIEALIHQEGWYGWSIHVLDRFGDYGHVGVVLAQCESDRLLLDTFLLSCRVLGRNVETAILTGLRHHCQQHGINRLLAEYRSTPKNQPIANFLENSPLQPESNTPTGILYAAQCTDLPEQASHVRLAWNTSPPTDSTSTHSTSTPPALLSPSTPSLLTQTKEKPSSTKKPETKNNNRSRLWSDDRLNLDQLLHKAHYLPLRHNTGIALLDLPVEDPLHRDQTTPHLPLRGEHQHQMALIWQEVLGCGPLGADDSFFALGGHSLKAVRMVSRIQKQFGVTMQLGELFEHPTIAALVALIRNRATTNQMPIQPVPQQASYPVSHAQLRLWILQQMESHAIAYNTASLYEFKGHLDPDILEYALGEVAQRHESLRTSFIMEQNSEEESTKTGFGQLRQRIAPSGGVPLLRIDLTTETNPDERVRTLAMDDARTPFDLATGPLYRVTLFRLADQRHLLLLNMHHIISDGWSMDVLQNDTMAYYAARVANHPPRLPPLTIQYKDYTAYQHARLSGPEAEQARAYWLQKLAGQHTPSLPTDFPRPPVQTFHGQVMVHEFTPELRSGLTRLGTRHQATLFMVLTALIKMVLLRHLGSQPSSTPILVGTPVAGRERPELEDQIGLYLNTLVLHDTLDPTETFTSLLAKVKQTITEAFEQQFYPFDRLVEELHLERDLSRSPLFDVMVVMQDLLPERPAPEGLAISTYDVDAMISRFDLVFNFFEQDQHLKIALTYNTDLFLPERIQRMLEHTMMLTASILANPDQPIRQLNMLSKEERHLLMVSFNAHRVPYPRHATIVTLFEEQVAATPLAMAVLEEENSLNYQQLNDWSNRIAHHLQTHCAVGNEEIIGLFAERSAALYSGLLGIMKAGGVCLPMDPATPMERLAFMIQDSGCRILLVEPMETLEAFKGIRLPLHAFSTGQTSTFSGATNLNLPLAPHNLAYIIYTSGSTGQPKGVLVEHGGFVNMALAQIRTFGVEAKDRVLQFSSPAFDASLSEVFMALLCGAALVPVRHPTIVNPLRLLDTMRDKGVTVTTFPPIYLKTLAATAKAANRPELDQLKTLITAGEAPILADALHFANRLSYFNAYGPTETSVCTTMYRVLPEPTRYVTGIPIGPPLDNLSVYLLDGVDQLVPVGVPGEIVVSGPGLARGYLNRPELTAERFVPNPWQPGERLYRTGDLGRWRSDGTIELLGRLDDQVKIRGNRVEPDEVAHHLRQHPDVQEVAVLVRTLAANTTELIAFVTPVSLQPERLRRWLEGVLPNFMIPSRLIPLDRLPLTISGKIDRKALLTQAEQETPSSQTLLPPGTDLEIRLVQVWQKILGRPAIGILDDFFTLGGDSIKAIQVIASLSDLGLETKDLFLHSTIASLATSIENRSLRPVRPVSQETVSGPVPLTAIQAWFFQDYPVDRHHFNHAEYFFFRQRLDEKAVHAALQAVQTHHDLLRARFVPGTDGRSVIQEIAGVDHPIDFAVVDLQASVQADHVMDQQTRELQSSLNLEQGPLLKTRLFRMINEDRLLIVIHHLIIDAVSWRFLLDDILRGYEQKVAGHDITLPRKSDSFQRWAVGVHAYSRSLALLREIDYWQRIEAVPAGRLPGGSLPAGSVNQAVQVRDLHVQLSREETADLQNQTAYRMIDILLEALAQAIQAWCGMGEIPIMLEGHGRESILEEVDVSRTVGWFTSVFPVILSISPTQTREEARRAIRATLEQIPNHGIGYSILKYLTPESMKPGMPLRIQPQISFNYLGDYRFDPGVLDLQTTSEMAPYRVSDRAAILYDLTFNAIVENGQLLVFLAYHPDQFDDSTMRTLLDKMSNLLTNKNLQPWKRGKNFNRDK